jgi:predicted LPLAT superfamily acyltransferase
MSGFFYRSIVFLSRRLGLWVFVAFTWIVSTAYFLFFPSRVRNSLRFYAALFPERRRIYHFWCAWRQFHLFSGGFIDRYLLQEFNDITYTSEGWEHLAQIVRMNSGGILLMSHVGNWEVAAHFLKRKDPRIRLLLYMGVRHREQIEQIQKESVSQSGVSIMTVDQNGGSPLDIMEGIRFLKSGGLVSLTGDLTWKKDQRLVKAKLLGHEVSLPEAPHLFALLSGAPLMIFFAFRTGKKKYHITMSEPMYLRASSREERLQAIQESVQRYADVLEETIRRHPLQWYHFEPFLGSKLD